ncbi:HAD family hydrolase [Coraliomargarita parva]|uniref:HAD family hydrolase n=1 Tax=Coraliomargarita parva TaxID=3014050 RepID=UPI0022B390DD|nr:hypothetical protein [Coraliomargarita parva]
MQAYSFDIFDTLIARAVATDRGVFSMMRAELRRGQIPEIPDRIVQEFFHIRIEAQKLAMTDEKHPHPEVTLDEIYRAMGKRYHELQASHLKSLQALEESVEVELCYGIPTQIERALALHDRGLKVILMSDMYLSKQVIEQILTKIEPRLMELPLYLSSELRVTKADGSLYELALKEEQLSPKQLHHTGDNFRSDCLMAKRYGVPFTHYREAELNPLEKAYLRESSNQFLQLHAGVSRQCRLQAGTQPPSYHLGAVFTGPLFFGFVHELLQKAQHEGIRRVYFLARDGYLMKLIADILVDKLQLEIDVRYLYVSRQSTYFASLLRLTEENLSLSFQEMDNVMTLELLGKRLRTEPEELLSQLDPKLAGELRSQGPKQQMEPGQVHAIKDAILKNEDFRHLIESKAATERELVLAYFRQEGLLDGGRIGCVDIGWKGTLQDAMFTILQSAMPNIAITSYYFAVTHYSRKTYPENRKIPYCMYPSTKAGIGPVFELLLQCPHGTTIKYSQDADGRYQPVLKAPAQDQKAWCVESYAEGIQRFSTILTGWLQEHPEMEPTYMGITPILVEKLKDADPFIATSLGDLLYSGNQEETRLRPMAPAFTFTMALRYIFASEPSRGWMTQWFDGSYNRSGLPSKCLLSLDPRRQIRKVIRQICPSTRFEEWRDSMRRRVKLLCTRRRT